MPLDACISCGKCCYFNGVPCKYLSKTQRCQIYENRINAETHKGQHCTFRKWTNVFIEGCPLNPKGV
jgi:hypothetical protein